MDTGSLLDSFDVAMSGGELILSVARIFSGSLGKSPDLAKLNLLVFLVEGDGGIHSDIMFEDTKFGPKSQYLNDFVRNHPDLVRTRVYGKKPSTGTDPDARTRVVLTPEGAEIAERAILSLPQRDQKIATSIVVRWGVESNGELLTYVCLFYGDFCRTVERGEDPKPLS